MTVKKNHVFHKLMPVLNNCLSFVLLAGFFIFFLPIVTDAQIDSTPDPSITRSKEADSTNAAVPSAAEPIVYQPPRNIKAQDKPNDSGGAILVQWDAPVSMHPGEYLIEIAGPDGVWTPVTTSVIPNYEITELENNQPYSVRIVAQYKDGQAMSEVISNIIAHDHWYISGKTPVLIAILLFISVLFVFFNAARKGAELFVRRITGLSAVEDAIGRATEMGRPVLYVPGISYIEDVATLAALNILGEVTRKIVHYDVKIIVPNIDPIVFSIAREIVKETYASEGRPDAFDPDSVFFMVPDQFAFAAGVNGIMVRQKPATIFYMGWFLAESLIMAETGAATGAVQIAGTDEIAQLPFFVTSCDYTLLGEELYAASAYLSKEPMLLATLKCQDHNKDSRCRWSMCSQKCLHYKTEMQNQHKRLHQQRHTS